MRLAIFRRPITGVTVCVAIAVVCGVILLSGALPTARLNQKRVTQYLQTAYAEYGFKEGGPYLKRVVMRTRMNLFSWATEEALIPGVERSVSGYRMKASVGSAGFTILARPEIFAGTGLLSFYRDETGRIWWESEPGKLPAPGCNRWY